MAEKVLIVNICDRCEHEEKAGTKKTLPKGWLKVTNNLDLCPECTTSFDNWMDQPKTVAAENQDAAANAAVHLEVHLPEGVDPVPTMAARDLHNVAVRKI